MKKIITYTLFSLFVFNTRGQKVDTSYEFYPKLVNQLTKIEKIDSISTQGYNVAISKDSNDLKVLYVKVFAKNGALTSEGRYKLDTTFYIYKLVVDTKTGSQHREVNTMRYQYLRDGYWYHYKREKAKKIFYHKGEKVRMK